MSKYGSNYHISEYPDFPFPSAFCGFVLISLLSNYLSRMAIQISYDEECDQGFESMHRASLETWLGTPGNATIHGPEGPVEFDQALVLYVFSLPLFYFFS